MFRRGKRVMSFNFFIIYKKNELKFKIALIFILFVTNVFAQIKQEKIKGGFKICNVNYYFYKNGGVDYTNRLKHETYYYDSKGNIISGYHYNSDKTMDKFFFKYDSKGKITKYLYYFPRGDMAWRQIYKYDNKGNKIIEEFYAHDESINSKSNYTYNKKNKLIKRIIHSSEGKVLSNTDYVYDGNNIVLETTYNNDGTLFSKFTYKYDKSGNIIEKEMYSYLNLPFIRYEYSYLK